MTILFSVVRFLGPVVVIVGLVLGYYEGIPGLRDIPGASYLPVVREFVVGRVELERIKAAKEATAGLVAESELAAERAKSQALQRQLEENRRLAEAATAQALRARIEAERVNQELEKRIEAESDPGVSRWTERDLDRWMRERSGRAN